MEKTVADMTFNEVMALEGKEKSEALKVYRKYLVTIINKLYMEASRYKDFVFSKNDDDLTPKEITHELINFLESKNYTKEQIKELIVGRYKK